MHPSLQREQARKVVATAGRFWLPTRPYSLVDAINRAAAATGSMRYAALAADASYNGHYVTVAYNSYRDYWVCEHFWAGRVVHARGSVESALRAGRYEYDRGTRGTSVIAGDLAPEEAQIALSLGYVPHTEEGEQAWNALYRDDRFECVHEALDARFGGDTIHLLLRASSAAEYRDARAKEWRERRSQIGARRSHAGAVSP